MSEKTLGEKVKESLSEAAALVQETIMMAEGVHLDEHTKCEKQPCDKIECRQTVNVVTVPTNTTYTSSTATYEKTSCDKTPCKQATCEKVSCQTASTEKVAKRDYTTTTEEKPEELRLKYSDAKHQVKSVTEATEKALLKVKSAGKKANEEIDLASGVAQAAIKVSSGDSAVRGAKDIFQASVNQATKSLETAIKESKEDLVRATSSAEVTCTADEKTSVTESIKVADAKLDAAIKLAQAELSQAQKQAQKDLDGRATDAHVSEQVHGGVLEGEKAIHAMFDKEATEALNSVKAETKNVRFAATPGEALDAKQVVKDVQTRYLSKLELANKEAKNELSKLAEAAKKCTSDVSCEASLAKVDAAVKEASDKLDRAYNDYKQKIDDEAKSVA